MPSPQQDESPGDEYFNDLSQQQPPMDGSGGATGAPDDSNNNTSQVPKQKRIACVVCRKRKLRCDGTKPACGTCTRLGHDCSYDEIRKKSGPKRGYVKFLLDRLAQVEKLVQTQGDPPAGNTTQNGGGMGNAGVTESNDFGAGLEKTPNYGVAAINMPQPQPMDMSGDAYLEPALLGNVAGSDVPASNEDPFPWEMIGLGLDEPLPTQDVVDDLNEIYFERVHPSMPMIHRPRYYAAMNLAPHMRPPICLRYAMWALAAASSDKYEALQEHFYFRARKYIQQDEMKGHGESAVSVAHCQAWALIGTYEFKLMYFPRAWMSGGRCNRLSLMMGLQRMDAAGLDVKQCIPPAKDWTEEEERRRTFWFGFCIDRYASIGTGWPMVIEESDIHTRLPAEEDAYELNRATTSITLPEAMTPSGPPNLSSFGSVVLLACLFGRNLLHLHRPGPDDRDEDLNGGFWRRHRHVDSVLLHTALALPDRLRLPAGLNSANVVFMNMNIHTSTICLHQAAIFKADKNKMAPQVSAESKVRCITAAMEIASIMRQICHQSLAAMNPFISFCLYVAARVFVQYLRSRPTDAQITASLQFLLTAMHTIKRKNPLTESFLVQLDVDMIGAGLESLRAVQPFVPPQMAPCVPGTEQQNPTFGDHGLASYTGPNDGSTGLGPTINGKKTIGCPAVIPSTSNVEYPTVLNQPLRSDAGSLSTSTFGDVNDGPTILGLVSTSTFDLPSRQRTPGQLSPMTLEMDTSPDGGGGAGSGSASGPATATTPASSGASASRTGVSSSSHSHGSYSPQRSSAQTFLPSSSMNMQASGKTGLTPAGMSMFDDENTAFVTDAFDLQNFGAAGAAAGGGSGTGASPDAFIGWSGASVPVSAAATAAAGGESGGQAAHHHSGSMAAAAGANGVGINVNAEMMAGMSEAEWTQVLESFTGWDGGSGQAVR